MRFRASRLLAPGPDRSQLAVALRRWRWPAVAIWVLGFLAMGSFAGQLSQVANDTAAAYLPSSVQSTHVVRLQQAMQQGGAGQMSPSAGDAEYANLAMKLNQGGLPGVATISSITESGAGSDPVNKAYDIGVSVDLENGQSYDTTVHQYLTQDAVNAY